MSPFRLFGPPPEPEPPTTAVDNGGVTWAPGPWAGDPTPATRHARPVGLDTRSPTAPATEQRSWASARGHWAAGPDDDPPTDPHGFRPIPASPLPAWSLPGSSGPVRTWPRVPTEPPDPQEAGALAGAFATDYLSWDEDDPGRRGRVLADHLAAPAANPALLGWDGVGRQRAEFALPGAVRPDGDDRVLVDVRVRVTPYRSVGDRALEEPGPEPDVPGVPATAPAPVERGWHGCASYWVRLIVPVVREDGRLVVDARDETLPDGGGPDTPGTEPEPAAAPAGPDDAPGPIPDRPPIARVPDLEPEEAW